MIMTESDERIEKGLIGGKCETVGAPKMLDHYS